LKKSFISSLLITLALAAPFAVGLVVGLKELDASYLASLAATFVFVGLFSAVGAMLEDDRLYGSGQPVEEESQPGKSEPGPAVGA
jgi:hypothetical protein